MDRDRHVVITGASTGIGRACVEFLARPGRRIHAGVRREADGEALAALGLPGVEPIVVDVADGESVAAAGRELARRTGSRGLQGVVNNAGISVVGPLELIPTDGWRRQFEVNLFGQLAVTRATLPLLRRSAECEGFGAPRIVFMSSIAGRVGQPILGPYCASKFAIEAVADALRVELRGQGIQVSLIEPGAVKSEIWRKGQATAAQFDPADPLTQLYQPLIAAVTKAAADAEAGAVPAERVARAVERCLTARRAPLRTLVGRDAKIAAYLKHWLPARLFDAVVKRSLSV